MAMEDLMGHVPELYVESIACHCIVKGIAIRRATDLIAACTTEGTLIEFSKKQVLNICEIKNCVPESVHFFVCYKPFSVFYLIKSQTNVYVVSREEGLMVTHEFKEVKKIVKNDFSNAGFPQIGLWLYNHQESERPHLITDLSTIEKKSKTSCDEFTMIYNKRYQELTMKCANLRVKLEEKKKLRFKCVQDLIQSELKEDFCDQSTDDLNLVTVFGEKSSRSCESQKTVHFRLEVRKLWQKIHHDQLIVGVQIVNKGEIPIGNLKLLLKLKDGETLLFKSYFYSIKESNESDVKMDYSSLITQWNYLEVLNTNVLATAIGVIKLSSFQLDRKLHLCGVITYSQENKASKQVYQLLLPSLELKIEDIVNGSLSLFQNSPITCEEELLTILVTSQCFQLSSSEPVDKILKEKLSFLNLAEYGRYYSGSIGLPYFAGVFVESWRTLGHKNHLNLYTKDSSQALALVQCLYSHIPHDSYIVPLIDEKSHDLQKMYNALEEEINFTVEQLSEWEEKFDIIEGNIHVPKKEYFQFRSSAFKFEHQTDKL